MNRTTAANAKLKPKATSRSLAAARSEAKLQRLIEQNKALRSPFVEDKDMFNYNRFGRLIVLTLVSAVLVAVVARLYI